MFVSLPVKAFNTPGFTSFWLDDWRIMVNYNPEVEHRYENGRPVTVRVSCDGRHELRAWGHLSEQEMDHASGTDHVHIWEIAPGEYRMHDMREHQRMMPELPDTERMRAVEKDRLIAQARTLLSGHIDHDAVKRAKTLQQEFNSIGRSIPNKTPEFQQLIDEVVAKWNQEQNRRK